MKTRQFQGTVTLGLAMAGLFGGFGGAGCSTNVEELTDLESAASAGACHALVGLDKGDTCGRYTNDPQGRVIRNEEKIPKDKCETVPGCHYSSAFGVSPEGCYGTITRSCSGLAEGSCKETYGCNWPLPPIDGKKAPESKPSERSPASYEGGCYRKEWSNAECSETRDVEKCTSWTSYSGCAWEYAFPLGGPQSPPARGGCHRIASSRVPCSGLSAKACRTQSTCALAEPDDGSRPTGPPGNAMQWTCDPRNGAQTWVIRGAEIRNERAGLCLDLAEGGEAGMKNGTLIHIEACTGGAWQQWSVGDALKNSVSSKCIDLAVGGAEGRARGAALAQSTCAGNAWQRWERVPLGGDRYLLRNKETGLCMDYN